MAVGVRRDGMSSDRDRAVDLAYRDHAPDVYRVAYAILRDADEAIDATHEAFARAWERWEQYDDRRPLRAWLHGIVVHEAVDPPPPPPGGGPPPRGAGGRRAAGAAA